ncbi:hypothetical protein GCM10023091_05910 [Ravibacter arvi]|uniref:Uncharacterized protein n=1 Tax=Ravibacter arvi TaxID=2051041 RepID=A0ABP8LN76_9BACT
MPAEDINKYKISQRAESEEYECNPYRASVAPSGDGEADSIKQESCQKNVCSEKAVYAGQPRNRS